MSHEKWAGANQYARWFLGDKGLGIQQEMSVWVSSPKYEKWGSWEK